ncbi:hypothetical protein FHR72_004885 [Mycolicibacterium iranicum]|uniref:DUF5666 domain-containing protein n=1 Tax=Mycolicibacterium iranicum TaxID=912594 RepID=A0A839QCN4_MYCIR|nr:hypothetical protein [Mycolicibacterium iranicum]MBB2993377.1 hypothetical protein [Mycolicibacterium iranicum]
MDTDHHEPASGDQPTRTRPWGLRETVTAVGVAAVIAGLGGAAAYAATGAASPQFGGPPGQHAAAPGGVGPGPGGRGPQQGPPVHGTVVVADGSGGFVTVVSQTGIVTATGPGSLTVRSEDGFTQTWTTTSGQGSGVGVDDSVMVEGRQESGAAARSVTQVFDPVRAPGR